VDRPAVPVTGREIRATLRSLGARPSRRLGQCFLADRGVLGRVVAAAAARPGDSVLEVGAGLGGLTAGLAAADAEVLAVEIDPALAGFLRLAFAGEPRVRVLEGDAMDGRGGLAPAVEEALPRAGDRPAGRFLVAANLPYGIATPLLLALLRRARPPDELVVMVQREVADRLRAPPGTAAYGPLSVLVQAVARIGTVLSVKRDAFHPRPAVASTVLRITPDPSLRRDAGDLDALRTAVHAAFGLRRKTLGNALSKAGLGTAPLAAAGVDPRRRAESLSPAEFVALARALNR